VLFCGQAGAKFVLIWCKMCDHLVLFASKLFRSCCQERRAGGGCMCGGCELMWSGGVVRHRVSEQRSWHRFGQTQKMTTAAVYAGHFGVSLPLFFFE
jgi:hypothetical protein